MTGPSLASSSNSYPASPVKPPRRRATNAEKWPHDFTCELDAVPPDHLRDLVQVAIEKHLPKRQLDILKTAEQSEREIIRRLVGKAVQS